MKNTLILAALVSVWLFALPGFVQAMPDVNRYQRTRFVPSDTGESIFQIYCAGCHGNDARGSLGPNIIGKTAQQITFAKANVLAMQGFELTPEEVTAVEGYLASLKPSADQPGVSQPAATPPASSPAPSTLVVSPPVTQSETETMPARFDRGVMTGIIAGVVVSAITVYLVARSKIFGK